MRSACAALMAGGALFGSLAASADTGRTERRPVVQMAILLDTSSSMDGLLEQAKTQLWRIVNEFATAKRRGKSPVLQVALYEYGKSSIPASEGYLRQILPLTTDLDKVSEELWKLATNGGDEYAGRVISAAVSGLDWSREKGDLKMIFIAGNEPFTQGPVDFRGAVKAAAEKGIAVNTVFCGPEEEGARTGWREGAQLADGKYLHIDQNRQVVQIAAPQDAELARLGAGLNRTYVAFGARGREGSQRQEAQDRAAGFISGAVLAMRASAKAAPQYSAASWDLVDAVQEGRVRLEDVKEEELGDELRKLKPAERKAALEARVKDRKTLREKIQKLSFDRDAYIVAQRKKKAAGGAETLDEVLIKAVREQAAGKDYKF